MEKTFREIISLIGEGNRLTPRYSVYGRDVNVTGSMLYLYNCILEKEGKEKLKFSTKQIEHASWWLCLSKKPFLLINGPVGTGKTTLAKVIYNFINKKPFEIIHWKDEQGNMISQQAGIAIKGFSEFVEHVKFIKANELTSTNIIEGKTKYDEVIGERMLIVDDIGCEPIDVNNYGNVTSPMVDFIDARYRQKQFTVFTSNLKLEDLGERYGERTLSRLAEMTEVITIVGDDFRRK